MNRKVWLGRLAHFLVGAAVQLAVIRSVENVLNYGALLLVGVGLLFLQWALAHWWEYYVQGWVCRTFPELNWDPVPDYWQVVTTPLGALAAMLIWM